MFDTGHMNFFKVDRCGLYKLKQEKTYGCELDETFSLIKDWVKGRSLAATIPWDPHEARRNKAKCYCKDIYKNESTNDYFVVLWKSDTDSAGTLWGAQEDNATGTGNVVKYTNEYKGKKVIWGRPCYYWIVPEENTVVSIKFDHSVCDAQLFEDYIKACINNRVQHENRKKEYTEKGYVRISYESDEANRFAYGFNMSLRSLETSNVELQKLASKVTHVIRRETIKVHSKDERAEWIKIFDKVPLVSAKPKSKKRKIEVKAEAKPTVKELQEIIENNAKEGRKPNDWDNVGFITETGITWVDKYRLRTHITISGKKDSLLTAEELSDVVTRERSRLIAPIVKANIQISEQATEKVAAEA